MPLTPQDVSNKRFTPVRLREGYDMGEVDQFLDEVEAELARLTAENGELRGRLGIASGDDTVTGGGTGAGLNGSATAAPVSTGATTTGAPTGDSPTGDSTVGDSAVGESATGDSPTPGSVSDARAAGTPAVSPAPSETIRVTTVAEASSAAVRLLEIATRNADQLVDEARSQADSIVEEARTTAEQVEADARNRSQLLDSETSERRTQLFGDLERQRQALNGEVDNLRTFEREYRSRLKSYFQQQLAALDAGDGAAVPGDGDRGPSRLQSLLGREQQSD
ncbi:MAG TPA: DivIVA domain-containing protein [Nocardioidaceae bacterium]|nr:DivIVA domain-containing protein [Nocardioidaceae bacterium]